MCAKQVINVGSAPNSNDGDALRIAFQKCVSNFDELYTDDTNDVNSIVATAPIARDNATGVVTISLNDAGIVTDKLADDAVTADKLANAINSAITANTAKVTNATHTGDVTGSGALTIVDNKVITSKILDANVTTAKIADDAVTADKLANSINTEIAANTAKLTNATHTGDVTGSGALTIATNAVTTAKILNDNITHDKLEARYTAEVAISTLTGTVSFNCANGSSFKLSGDLTGAYTINLSNYKKGQVITIFPLKAQTVTLAAQGSSSNTFNKIGGIDYDNTVTSVLQLECTDDSASAPIFFYSIATFAADNTI
jgi:hypothetical protein